MTVKEPPRRALRVPPPYLGGEFYTAPRVDYFFTRPLAGAGRTIVRLFARAEPCAFRSNLGGDNIALR